jgi:hypothetical protein
VNLSSALGVGGRLVVTPPIALPAKSVDFLQGDNLPSPDLDGTHMTLLGITPSSHVVHTQNGSGLSDSQPASCLTQLDKTADFLWIRG